MMIYLMKMIEILPSSSTKETNLGIELVCYFELT